MSLSLFEDLARKAVRCRVCFEQGLVTPPTLDLAQPRWVGSAYWAAKPRIAVLMLNPGSGASLEDPDKPDNSGRDLLQTFADGRAGVRDYFKYHGDDMRNWGKGRFCSFFFHELGLDLQSTAFANVAWCASKGDEYPRKMLDTCYERHTSKLFRILTPKVIILSGSKVHRFSLRLQEEVPDADIIKTLHYAHRKGYERQRLEIDRVRAILSNL